MVVKAFRRARVLLPAVLLVLAFVLPTSVHAQGLIHIVRPGENLTRIAIHYGASVQAIVRANGLRNPNVIYVGQRLIIPGGGGGGWTGGWPGRCGCVHIVRGGENLSMIARRYGVPMWALAAMNGLRNPNYIWAGQRLCVPCTGGWVPSCPLVHVVQRGQTMYSIALRYGTCVQAIAAANGISNPNVIYAGQRLCIPGGW